MIYELTVKQLTDTQHWEFTHVSWTVGITEMGWANALDTSGTHRVIYRGVQHTQIGTNNTTAQHTTQSMTKGARYGGGTKRQAIDQGKKWKK